VKGVSSGARKRKREKYFVLQEGNSVALHKKVILLAHFVVSRNGIWRVERITFNGRRFPGREPIFDNVGLSLA
jgi:hypothetical protein